MSSYLECFGVVGPLLHAVDNGAARGVGEGRAVLSQLVARSTSSAQAVDRATALRQAIKRLTDAYTWGALAEADYRSQLRTSRLNWSDWTRRRTNDA